MLQIFHFLSELKSNHWNCIILLWLDILYLYNFIFLLLFAISKPKIFTVVS